MNDVAVLVPWWWEALGWAAVGATVSSLAWLAAMLHIRRSASADHQETIRLWRDTARIPRK